MRIRGYGNKMSIGHHVCTNFFNQISNALDSNSGFLKYLFDKIQKIFQLVSFVIVKC